LQRNSRLYALKSLKISNYKTKILIVYRIVIININLSQEQILNYKNIINCCTFVSYNKYYKIRLYFIRFKNIEHKYKCEL